MNERTTETAEKGQAERSERDSRGCLAETKSGEPCQGPVLPGRPYCLFHSPEHREAIEAGRSRGGQTRQAMLAPVDLGIGELDWVTREGLRAITAAAAEKMLLGQLDSSRARAIGDMAAKLLAGLRDAEAEAERARQQVMERRLAAVEVLLRELEGHGDGGD